MKKINLQFFKKLPAKERILTLSTIITCMRIALIPFIVAALVFDYWKLSFWLFAAAAWSDVLDGALARWRNEQTLLGACLDPLADKLLLLAVFFTFAFWQSPLFSLPTRFVWFVLLKELLLVSGAFVLYLLYGYVEIAPTKLGKMSTFVQVCFVTWIFICHFFAWLPFKTYQITLILMTGLIFLTLLQYARIGFKQLLNMWGIADEL